ncbi:ABC transporter permease [Aureimonas fodinaquatilis]|uniref:ABC transporter permease n=1 Tax=Aureimonas fodinaquatilis TaxID=2565783 RepID=A0A5B0E3D3_9HYPH|nr:ABC transporter permease [Aureimonas fodinaquatilis]KAA0971899.1 ABC transporter permease [Aureimonas fodinaquatilis]
MTTTDRSRRASVLPDFIDTHVIVLFFAAVAVFAALGFARPDIFLSAQNLQSMLLQISVIGLLSLAVALTLLTGGIDLSINAVANLASIVAASFLSASVGSNLGLPPELLAVFALVVGLVVGLLCGLFNGFLIAVLGYSPILATLGTMTLFIGFGTVITGGSTLFGIASLANIGRGAFLGIPFPAIVFVLIALGLAAMLHGRRLGFNLYLYGANPTAARYSGINTRKLLLIVYAISGALSGLAGIVNLSVTNSANVDFGSSYVLLAILVSVLGGISPLGGVGKILGVIFSVIILQLLSTGLNLILQASGSNFLRDFAWGLTLILVLAIGRVQFGSLQKLFSRHSGTVEKGEANGKG